MNETPPDRDPLERLAEEYMEQQRLGQSPSVEEYAASHPDLAEEIRELFPTISAMERLKARSERSSDGTVSLGPIQLERLGDFRILREIGRGGMGIVFEAQQESLDRRVAVKVLPRQALLEERQLERFRREAKVASHLHHTNIVQVYGVGEEDGFHYYVMQYVQGIGLDKIIHRLVERQSEHGSEDQTHDDSKNDLLEAVVSNIAGDKDSPRPTLSRPNYYRTIASIGEQAASALTYAHEMGTLHRDIKPSNLLLDDHGVVWITDFGLARATQVSQVTHTGDLTGTLRYLPPEQLHGQTDARGDIYSLALTLYELLTLTHAYEQTDRVALLHELTTQSPAPPRLKNPAIPRDLETIVLKGMSHHPEDRYETATELVDDLRRFLEDRPIRARRIGYIERMWRWCRRNKAVASLAASTIILILTVAIVATIGYIRTRNALAREAQQRQRAQTVSHLATDVLDRVFQRLGPVRVVRSNLTVGGMSGTNVEIIGQSTISKETAALLEEILPFYNRLAEQTGDDTAMQLRAASARKRIGDIRQRLGQYARAIAAYQQAIEMYHALTTREPNNPMLRVHLAETCNALGQTYLLLQRPSDAQTAYRDALDILKTKAVESSLPARFELAQTHYFLGQRVPPAPGIKPHRENSNDPPENALPDHPPPDGSLAEGDRVRELKQRPVTIGPRPQSDPNREERNHHLDQAIMLLKSLQEKEPANPDYSHLLALCYREYVPAPGEARQSPTDKAITILEGLVQDYPQMAKYRFDLCETYAAIETIPPGEPHRVLPIMEQRLQKALALSKELTLRYPNVPEYQASQAQIYHRFGGVFRMMRRLAEAQKNDQNSLNLQTKLVNEFQEVVSYQIWQAVYRNSLAAILLRRNQLPQAQRLAKTNIRQLEQLLHDHPNMWYLHAPLADAYRTLSATLRHTGQHQSAQEAMQTVEKHRAKLEEHKPRNKQ